MKKTIVTGITVLLPFLFGYLCFIAQAVITTSLGHRSREASYFRKSEEILHKFDSERRSNLLSGLPKLSTNTYLDRRNALDNTIESPSRENATILMLVRNWELDGALKSMRSLEDRFNGKYHYDWTFLNDVPFENAFIEATTAMASGRTAYGLIPPSDWNRPDTVDEEDFENCLQLMEEKGVIYGGSRSYRNMCRFNSGYFFRQKLLDNYQYYFRVEPDVEYYCDFPYDPFKLLREQRKKYGFVISMYEYEDTIPTLWDAVEDFMADNSDVVDMTDNLYQFITDDSVIGKDAPIIQSNSAYNLCHFWSNFEVGDLSFFRSDEYLKYFEALDARGGFYYERWGDAPVHSIAVALLLKPSEVIHFDQIGYYHVPFGTCPAAHDMRLHLRCLCDPTMEENIDIQPHSCLVRWWKCGSGKFFMQNA
ncbi:LADA_0E05160g1_1 [Lachancea dasiensis]|uniref:LADA_0E05160g1_1 n=1 Tax=Lachancea dasiensis TaxID=1072105 RepID=A0A1G4JCL0_9SACH|nr:LADA_0E05160g1_1 [Lachancea dasiensis]